MPSRVADLAELRALLEPVKQAGRGVVALLPGGVFPNQEVFRLQREVGRPFTWTALLTVKGYPYHEKVIAEHDAAWADGRGGVAAGLVPSAGLPDEPVRAVHVEHAPDVRRADGQAEVRAGGGVPRPGLARDGVGGRERAGRGVLPLNWAADLGGRVALAPGPGGPPGRGAGRGARVHARST